MSVLLVLTLVTTISFDVYPASYAEGEEAAAAETQQAAPAEQAADPAAQQAAPADPAAAGGEAAVQDAAPAEGETPADAVPAEGQTPSEGVLPPEQVEEEEPESSDPLDTGLKRQTTEPEVTAESYIVMSGSTSEIVLEKHSERKLSPGSITMLMTAMVVVDNMYNESELNNTVEITTITTL